MPKGDLLKGPVLKVSSFSVIVHLIFKFEHLKTI